MWYTHISRLNYSPLTANAYQLITGLTSSCPQTVERLSISLGATYAHHVESPSHCWFSRPVLPLTISSYQNYSRYCFGTGPPCLGIKLGATADEAATLLCAKRAEILLHTHRKICVIKYYCITLMENED